MSRAVAKTFTRTSTTSLEFDQLYEEHGEFIHALLAKLIGPRGDPDDLGQEVWLVASKKLPKLGAVEVPRAWLCQIALNVAVNARRRARWRQALHLRFHATTEIADRRTPEALTEARELTACAYQVLDGIAEAKRNVFILFEMLGMSGQDIAEAMGCPLHTIYSRLHYARREFLDSFEKLSAASGPRPKVRQP